MSTAVATQQQKPTGLRQWIQQAEIRNGLSHALGGWMDTDDYIAQVLIAFNHPDIAVCSEKSKFEAAHTCASLALLPTKEVGHVALIPRNKDNPQVTVMVQWQGYKSLMERHPAVLEINAELVHSEDRFAFANGEVAHEYDPFSETRNFGKELEGLRGGYLTITYTDGRAPKYHFLNRAEILKRKACAETTKVWDKWPRQQALKSVFRDGYARRVVPIDPLVNQRLGQATMLDDELLGNDPQRVTVDARSSTVVDSPHMPPAPASRSDAIAARLEQQQPPEPQPCAGAEPPAKLPAEENPPPDVRDSLSDFASDVHRATTQKAIKELAADLSKTAADPDELDEGLKLCEWKLEQLKAKRAGGSDLFDKGNEAPE